MYIESSEWKRKGATLSDKSARKEYDLTQEEIIEAIKGGKLQYRQGNAHGNPFFRLLRREVEMLVLEKYGKNYLEKSRIKNELAEVIRELNRLKRQVTSLERKRTELQTKLDKAML